MRKIGKPERIKTNIKRAQIPQPLKFNPHNLLSFKMDPESDSLPASITIHTPWEDVEKILNPPISNLPRLPDLTPLLSMEERPPGFLSLVGGPNSRSLPPLMTETIRQECRYYRSQAQTVQKRLEEQRRQRILALVEQRREQSSSDEDQDDCSTCSSSDDESPVIVSRSASRLSPAPPSMASKANRTAFQSLIHRLRRNVQSPFVDQAMMTPGSPYASTQSVNTVVENPVFRARSGSYTLIEPSPVMKAYMAEHSDISDMSIMSRSSPNLLEKSRELRQELESLETRDEPEKMSVVSKEQRAQQLIAYLGDLSRMPVLPKKKERPVVDNETNEVLEMEDDNMSIDSSVMHSMSIIAVDVPVEESAQALGDLNPVVEPISNQKPELESTEKLRSDTPPTETPGIPVITIKDDDSGQEKEEEDSDKENEPPEGTPESSEPVTTIASTPQGDRGRSVREIEDAVSSLAQAQQKQIQALLKAQENQREELKRMFEEQQQRLVQEIMGTISQSKGASIKSEPLKLKTTPLPFTPEASVQDRAPSPMIPALASQIRPTSTLPNGYKFPAKALDPKMHVKYCKLSALAKGFLVRRLLKTTRVQTIIESMKDIMNMALQLHREAKTGNRPVTAQDLDLHRRLLQQLNKDYHSLYDVFFNLSTSEKMGIISSDHAIRHKQIRRSKSDQRRVSAVTQAKLEQKKQLRELGSLQNGNYKSGRGQSKSASRSRSLEGPARLKERRSSRRSLYNATTDSKKPSALTNQKNNRNILNNIGVSVNKKKTNKKVVPWK